MIIIHPRFRNEAEALEATTRTLDAARLKGTPGWTLDDDAARRIASLAHELTTDEIVKGYAGRYRAAVCAKACTCAVCVSRRTP